MPKISVVLPTFNRCDLLEKTLMGFQSQEFKSFEIVIVIDGSSDNTIGVIEGFSNRIPIKVHVQENSGRAAARNAGLRLCDGEFIVFCDDDRIPHPKFLSEHLKACEKSNEIISIGKKHDLLTSLVPELKIPLCRVKDLCDQLKELVLTNETKRQVTSFSFHELEVDILSCLSKWDLGPSSDNRLEVVDFFGVWFENFEFSWVLATTASLAMSRRILDGIQFDEDFSGWGLEDTDFAYQLALRNARFYFNFDAINYHQFHSRSPGAYTDLLKNAQRMLRKYPTLEILLLMQHIKRKIDLIDANCIVNNIRGGTIEFQEVLQNLLMDLTL